ncbi:MAG: ATP-dependent protease subunit HslV [Deferribacteres bacterium]|nr:ATP-dependent protease subunit HslV [candidate division KSB1 bacterium]MCB9511330.1 ATP-dependent protease subunit HslV [Deferribacteres bacterium]
MKTQPVFRSTTILGVRHKGQTVLAGDGQVSFGSTVLKAKAKKVRAMYKGEVLAGFAGAAADAFTLFEKFEQHLESARGKLGKAAIELAKEWRTDRYLRRLEAQLVVMDRESTYLISGTGDLIEPDDEIVAIGSGSGYALAAARALVQHSDLDARMIAEQAMRIAADICIYTNDHLTIEELQ